MIESVIEAVRAAMQNEVAGSVFVLSLLGAGLAILRRVPGQVFGYIRRQVIVTVDVPGHDSAFAWLTEWLDAHPYSKRARLLTATSRGMRAKDSPGAEYGGVLFTPAPGNHLLWYRGKPIWLSRVRKDVQGRGGDFMGYQETIELRMFGRSSSLARTLIEDAHRLATAGERRVSVNVLRYGEWYRVTQLEPRPLDSVILPDGQMDAVSHDLDGFLAGRQWYVDRGIPWRRGYLFEGLPGTGKSSIVSALAGHLGMDLYICGLSERGMTDQSLTALLLQVPARSILLLEDIDGVVKGREMQTEGVTFSGLLNALDGVASRPGVVTVMTTNHADQLDPALVRSGRVDYRVTFAAATPDQLQRLFNRFYGESAKAADAAVFARAMAGCVMADAQAVLLQHKHDPVAACEQALRAADRARLRALA